MSKTAPQIEAEIRAALDQVRGTARGLYHEMRHIASNLSDKDRPGELRRHGSPMEHETIAQLTGHSSSKVTPLLAKLSARHVRLVGQHPDGTWFLPHLQRLHAANARAAEKTRRSRVRKKGGNVTPVRGVTIQPCNRDVTETVPPDGFSPHPSSLSPSGVCAGGGAASADGKPEKQADLGHADAISAAFSEPATVETAAAALARHKADARDQARMWVSANRPDMIRKFGSMAELIEFEGEARGWPGARERAIAAAEPATLDPEVNDPWAWTLAKLRGTARRPGRPGGPSPPAAAKPTSPRPAIFISGKV